jgi:hypothetical protein
VPVLMCLCVCALCVLACEGVRGEYKLRQYADHLFFNDYARGCG